METPGPTGGSGGAGADKVGGKVRGNLRKPSSSKPEGRRGAGDSGSTYSSTTYVDFTPLPLNQLQKKGTIEVEHRECRLKKSRKSSSTMAELSIDTHRDTEIKWQKTIMNTKKEQYLVAVKLTRQINGANPTATLGRKGKHSIIFVRWKQALR